MSTEQQETVADPARPSLKTFKPTAFQLSQFEVVQQATVVDSFQVLKFVSLGSASPAVDPMFEVYDQQFTSESPSGDSEAAREEQQAYDAEGDTDSSTDCAGTNDKEVAGQGFDLKAHERELAANQAEEDRKALEEEHARQLEAVRTIAREDALAEARRESDEKLKEIEERYASLIDDMSVQIHEGVEGVERRAVDFAIHIAKKLVGAIVEVNPEYVLGIIKEAVKLTGGATIKVIRVSPQDLEFLKLLSQDRQFKEFDASWSFQADETIHAGCVLETSSGEVEFELDKAWDRIKESVLKVR
jgi:flagellar biosynthesis/type III secretory pathway protein FliH